MPYLRQTFADDNDLTAPQVNQLEENVRSHKHDGNEGTAIRSIDSVLDDIDSAGYQEIFSITVPGGFLGTKNACRFQALAYTESDTSESIQLRVKYGATTICTADLDIGDRNNNPDGYELQIFLYSTGATNTQAAVAKIQGLALEGTANAMRVNFDHGTAAEDSTGDLTFSVEVQASTPGAVNLEINHKSMEFLSFN